MPVVRPGQLRVRLQIHPAISFDFGRPGHDAHDSSEWVGRGKDGPERLSGDSPLGKFEGKAAGVGHNVGTVTKQPYPDAGSRVPAVPSGKPLA